MLMLNRVAKRCQTCLIKQRSNPTNKQYLWIQVKERAQNACARKTCLTKPSKRTKCFKMFDQMFDGIQILSNNTKQGVQMGKCLVTKHFPFGQGFRLILHDHMIVNNIVW